MKSRNWPPKGLSLEVTFAPAIAVACHEHGGLDSHVAKSEFADNFVQKHDFEDFQITKFPSRAGDIAF